MARQIPISGNTRVYGILGNPVTHSLSPLLHNHLIHSLGIDAVYVPLGGQWADAQALGAGFLGCGLAGASVTIPHKELAAACGHWTDPVASLAGSANTLLRRDGKIEVYNTDGPGALRSLGGERWQSWFTQKSVVVFGNGGTALGILAALLALPLGQGPESILVVGRNSGKLGAMLDGLSRRMAQLNLNSPGEALGWSTFDKFERPPGSQAVVYINTTSIGMSVPPEQAPFPISANAIEPTDTVFDAVYTPANTDLVSKALAAGAQVVHGYEMLLQQALLQMELFYQLDEPPPADPYRALLADFLNIGG